MLIGDLLKFSELSVEEIQLYEIKKLIKPKIVKKKNVVEKSYSVENLKTIKAISSLVKANFNFTQIKVMLDFPETIPIIFNDYICYLIKRRMPQEMIDNLKCINLGFIDNVVELANELHLVSSYMELIRDELSELNNTNQKKIKFFKKVFKSLKHAHIFTI